MAWNPISNNEIPNLEEVYTQDLRGLNKTSVPVAVMGKALRFFPLSMPQYGYLFSFLIEGIAPFVLSKTEIENLDRESLYGKVCESFIGCTEEQKQAIMGLLMSTTALSTYINPIIDQCFPDLDPNMLTDNAYAEVFNFLLEDTFKNANIKVDE